MIPSAIGHGTWRLPLLGAALLAAGVLLAGEPEARPPDDGSLVLTFTYSSDKEPWIKEMVAAFNAAGRTTGAGRRIRVAAEAMGSGEAIDELLKGHSKAHLTSPASTDFILLANERSRKETGKPLVGPTHSVALSPLVLALWKPMAVELGWPKTRLGWADVLQLARAPRGWAARGRPEWGRFKFGHTHPDYSGTGLRSLFAQAYAAAGKSGPLTPDDVARPAVGDFLKAIERAVVHYGDSTRSFADKMMRDGQGYMHAAVLSENLVVEANSRGRAGEMLVAVYPRDGTFWSDHPIGVVQRDHVTAEHRAAAELFSAFLRQKPQQQRAVAHGLRPAIEGVPTKVAPLDAEHGVDPLEPKRLLEVPTTEVMNTIIRLWRERKKPARVVLVLDTSGSMNREGKLEALREGASEFLSLFGQRDTLSLLTFNSKTAWVFHDLLMDDAGRKKAEKAVQDLHARGETSLYDAIDEACSHLGKNPQAEVIPAIVVLSDGLDNRSTRSLEDMLQRVRAGKDVPRIFTIGYSGKSKSAEVERVERILADVARATGARFYPASTTDICEVFKDIATYF